VQLPIVDFGVKRLRHSEAGPAISQKHQQLFGLNLGGIGRQSSGQLSGAWSLTQSGHLRLGEQKQTLHGTPLFIERLKRIYWFK
jgi:hypothetical protein